LGPTSAGPSAARSVQRAEAAGDYESDADATAAMAADERVHALVVAELAQRHRVRASGWFRAAVFGANDGLVSNFSLVAGMAGAGSASKVILLATTQAGGFPILIQYLKCLRQDPLSYACSSRISHDRTACLTSVQTAMQALGITLEREPRALRSTRKFSEEALHRGCVAARSGKGRGSRGRGLAKLLAGQEDYFVRGVTEVR
jgi:hypothetical protein